MTYKLIGPVVYKLFYAVPTFKVAAMLVSSYFGVFLMGNVLRREMSSLKRSLQTDHLPSIMAG